MCFVDINCTGDSITLEGTTNGTIDTNDEGAIGAVYGVTTTVISTFDFLLESTLAGAKLRLRVYEDSGELVKKEGGYGYIPQGMSRWSLPYNSMLNRYINEDLTDVTHKNHIFRKAVFGDHARA